MPPTPAPSAVVDDAGERLGALVGDAGRPAEVALLGDSFAAGEGAGSYQSVRGVADSLCHRSADALLADAAGTPPSPSGTAILHNLACSRARMSSVTAAQAVEGHGPEGVPAQLEQLAGIRADLVLLSIGGNDLGFAGLLQACVVDTEPCGQDPALRETTRQQLLQLQAPLTDVYRTLGAATPAPVLVLPYPRLFDAGAEDCGRLTSTELAFGLEITDALNSTIERSVQAANLPNVRYVNALEDSFAGRGACSPDPLVNTARFGPLLNAATSVPASQEVLHPTQEGYRVLTRDLLRWLEENPM
ncbi:SGNH/GDSL hydrolase family protein [Arthrobacter sp. zg-Y820]|uniref:SGNH/GDSL hydrolase family protein n=1 Tax=unclassified Arthrobacter TaxID=235627 RepID=UPI001E55CBDD|nr:MULTISPECIES: SGNH/GDSL hydrolase family protein [unclassified Arthrobacter]MCC9195349.1 SGNH/GDSL hydrolase family protein [Arthrobacter sp. zg-Y820]MDK1278208.1 SGNH/GDSL hydrolase family protein [Arthrobacter sp. zg.Y820]WIB11051.1 SGNH/GDSL hydrolase family protein [Arthrobacter sp. zg-Y820]